MQLELLAIAQPNCACTNPDLRLLINLIIKKIEFEYMLTEYYN